MEPSFVGIVRFDFFLEDSFDRAEDTLADVYQDVEEDGSDPLFFGLAPETQLESRGTAAVRRYASVDHSRFDGDPFAAFENVRTFVLHQDSRRFRDAITIAGVSESEVESLDETDLPATRETVRGWQENLSLIGERTGSIVFDDVFAESYPLALQPTILYVDVPETVDVWTEDGNVSESACRTCLEDARRFLLGDEGCVSAMASGELLGTQQLGEVWGPLTAVNVLTPEREYSLAEATAVDLPDMGALVNRLTPFFRAFDWVHFRLHDVDIVNAELVDTSANVMDLEEGDEREYLETLLGEEEEVGRIQNYLDYSQVVKELEDVDHLISGVDYRSSDDGAPFPTFERPISEPTDTTLRSTTYFSDSLFTTYQSELTHLLNKLDQDLATLDERLIRISNIVTDKITITGTEASIQLDDRVRRLTWALVILTVLLLIGRQSLLEFATADPVVLVVELVVRILGGLML